MVYEEVNPTAWIPKTEGEFIEGILLFSQADVGVNKSMIYNIETEEGIKSVWGSVILDSKMALVKVGEKIKITYLGKAKEKKGGKNPAKLFKVEIDKV